MPSSMYQTFRQALLLNNEGVEKLSEERDQEAIVLLTKSLTLVKQVLTAQDDDAMRVDHPSSQCAKKSDPIHQPCPFSLSSLSDLDCFVYSRPVLFSLEEDTEQTVPERDTHIYSAVIIFNIALTYHRRGLSAQSAAPDVCLLKAEKMYDMVLSLLACDAFPFHHNCTSTIVKFAALNNLSQLKHFRGEYHESVQGFQYLGSLLNSMVTSSELTFGEGQEEQLVYQGMLLNAICIAPPDAAAAA